jgi:hypothetical protein
MKQGSKVELPLWLAEMLAVSNPSGNSSLATLDLPQALSQRVMNALKADPKTVDLRAQAQHFYNIGARMLELFEEEEMVDILTDVSVGIHDFYNHLITSSDLQPGKYRHSNNVQLRSQIKRQIHGVRWVRALSLRGAWTIQNDSVSHCCLYKNRRLTYMLLQCSVPLMIAPMQLGNGLRHPKRLEELFMSI